MNTENAEAVFEKELPKRFPKFEEIQKQKADLINRISTKPPSVVPVDDFKGKSFSNEHI